VIRGPIVKGTFFFFYCAKKHKKFTILINLNVQYSGSNHMHKVVQQISKPFLSCKTETLYPLIYIKKQLSFPPSSTSEKNQSIF